MCKMYKSVSMPIVKYVRYVYDSFKQNGYYYFICLDQVSLQIFLSKLYVKIMHGT